MRLNTSLYLIILSTLLVAAPSRAFAQSEKRLVRQGNREYNDQKYGDAEIAYRRALSSDENYADAVFNVGDALYNQGKYEEAAKQFEQNFGMNEDKTKKASAMYNIGNSLLKTENYAESIEAYKNSLRLDPNNMEAKYNLAYAQDMLQQQQNQQNNENKQDQDQQNQQNQDQQNQDQQNQDQQNQDQQNLDQQNQGEQDQSQEQISREDAERILNALANDEKEIQERVNEEKAKAAVIIGSGKNW